MDTPLLEERLTQMCNAVCAHFAPAFCFPADLKIRVLIQIVQVGDLPRVLALIRGQEIVFWDWSGNTHNHMDSLSSLRFSRIASRSPLSSAWASCHRSQTI